MSFWDDITGAKNIATPAEKFGEWVHTDNWFGDYVDTLESNQQRSTSPSTTPAVAGQREEGKQAEGSNQTDLAEQQEQSATPKKLLPRWKTMTPAQRENNKRLQREYRDRKRERLNQANAIVGLSSQLTGLDGLTAEADQLEVHNQELQYTLQQKEEELLRARMELLEGRTLSATFAASQAQPAVHSQPPSKDQALEEVRRCFTTKLDELTKFLEAHVIQPSTQLEPAPGIGATATTAAVVAEIQRRVKDIMEGCLQFRNLHGPDDLERLVHTIHERTQQPASAVEKYAAIVQKLQLSEAQVAQVIELQKAVLAKLEGLYAKRQSQNMTVLALMGPSMVPQQQSANRLQTATDYGAMLREELGTLKGNLAEEQQLESEQHYIIFKTILTPSQGAWMIAWSNPTHCDTLAFMAAVHAASQQRRQHL